MKVDGSVALITGGASGLGLGAGIRLVDGGASVALLDVNAARGEEAAATLGGAAVFLTCDIRSPDEVADSVQRCLEEWGRIDILINAAGVAP